MLTSLLIKNAEIYGVGCGDIRCENGIISAIHSQLTANKNDLLLDAKGNALLPGLHDHHMHLYALAATQSSIPCGPPWVNNSQEFAAALQAHHQDKAWIRGVQYHESVAGELDRYALDKIVKHKPLRIQHRSGKMWVVNSVAAEALELDSATTRRQVGIERDSQGIATGRLFRLDSWMREKLSLQEKIDLSIVSRQLASVGVTGFTDTTHSNNNDVLQKFSRACADGELLQRVWLMGGLNLSTSQHPFIQLGQHKIMLDEDRLPELDALENQIRMAHQHNRGVAFHCVTETELVFALTALGTAGKHPQDRIEHASLTPAATFPLLLNSGVTVVTQPNFIRERGEQYLQNVERENHAILYRGKSLLDAGIPLGGGTDAPYGEPNPWFAMAAAVLRATPQGIIIGENEKLTPDEALALFISPAQLPGGGPRQLMVGAEADFCLLDRPWHNARNMLAEVSVVATIRAGSLIYP